ncbi:hypothetical protein QTP70_008709 [Hemibagrus guttatus]|uniref:Uncharacterized protein n=1 Tax=Hemibagrus guttatus TaxID=175788 RepID=A0AAE0R5M7_9TELE|nr:hypothetical protein QTP70_008709 [Hemibagrus guttatus]
MSCLDVMYQNYGAHHYLPATAAAAYKAAYYHHQQQQQKKFSAYSRMQDFADLPAHCVQSKQAEKPRPDSEIQRDDVEQHGDEEMAVLSARVRVALCPLHYGTVVTRLRPTPASPPFLVISLQLLHSTQQTLAFGVAIAWPSLACPLIQPSQSHGLMAWVAKAAPDTIMSMRCTPICIHVIIIPTLTPILCSITATAVLWIIASVPFCYLA